MSNIVLKAHSATQTLGEVAVTQGAVTKVKAQRQVNYELLNTETGRAPDHIITKRVGQDLHISLDKEGQNDDIIIEGYYDNADAALIGLAEDGQYYYYIPDTGEVADYVTQLANGDIEGQALGGQSYIAPWWMGATEAKAGILPWLVGLAAVGGLAALAGGSDDDDKSAPADTTAPTVEATRNPDNSVSVKTEPNAIITDKDGNPILDNNGNPIVADQDGNATIPADKVPADNIIGAKDPAGNTATDTVDAADTTAPSAPDVVANDNGSVTVQLPNDADADKATVTYTDENGEEKTVTFTKDEDGNWVDDNPNDNVTLDPTTGLVTIPADEVKDDTPVTAVVEDKAGNKSEDTDTAKVPTDVTPPSAPDVVANDNGSVTVQLPNDPDADKATVTYTDENGEEKTVTFTKDEDGNWVDDNPNDNVTLDPTTGLVTIPADEVKDDTPVTAVVEDKAGNKSEDTDTAKVPTDVTPPSAPDVVAKDNGDVTVQLPNDPDADKATVTYTDENGEEKTVTFTKDEDGNWVDDNPNDNVTLDPTTGLVTIPADEVKDDTPVTAVVEDKAGNKSEDTDTAKVPTDVTPPSAPDVVAKDNGDVTVQLPNDPDADKATVTYTDENGEEKTVTFTKDEDGNWVDDNPNDNVTLDPTTGLVTIPADEVKDDTPVTAVVEDKAGNKSEDTDTAKVPTDVTPPSAPTVEIVGAKEDGKINPADLDADGKVTVKVTPPADAEVGDTVTVTGPNGQTVTVPLEDKDGDGTPDPVEVKITPAEDGEETKVTAIVTDKANNPSQPTEATADTDAKVPGDSDGDGVADDAGKPVVVIADNDDGSINPADVDEDGKVDAKVTFPADSGYSVGDTVKITDQDGNTVLERPLTQEDLDNGIDVKVTPAAEGEDTVVTAVVTDAEGNSSTEGQDTATTDLKVPGDSDGDGVADDAGKPVVVIADNDDGSINPADVDEDGKVDAKVTFPADSGYSVGDTVKITDQDGNTVLERPLTQEDLDNGIDVKVTPAAEGEDTVVTAVVTDAEGNSSTEGQDTATTDLKVPGDSDGDGVADDAGKPQVVIADNDDGSINPADVDEDGKVDAKVTFPADSGYSVGDTVKITDQDGNTVLERPLTQEDLDNGIDVKVTPAAEGEDTVVTAVVTDAEGNSSTEGQDTATTDLKVPGDSDGDGVADDAGKPQVVIADNDDGSINPADVDEDGKVDAKVTFPADSGYSVGDTVKITDQDGNTVLERPLTQEDLDNGIDVKVTPAAEGEDTVVTAVVTDAEGNSSTEGQDTATTDLKVPGDSDGDGVADDAGKPVVVIADNDDGSINPADVDEDGKVDAKVTFPADSGYSVGDTVKITDQDGNTVLERPLTQEDLDNGIDVKVTPAAEGEDTVVTAVVTDAEGNSSTEGQDTATTDLKVPGDSDGDGVADDAGKPQVVIADNDDGSINPADVDEDGKVDAKVTFPADSGYSVGDTVKITDQDGNTVLERPLTQEDLDNGIDVKVTPAAEGEDTVVTAVVTDAEGNSSTEGQDTATTDLKVPGDSDGDGVADDAGKPQVVIADNDDGSINPADVDEDGKVDAKVTFPADSGYSVGDTVKITDQDGNTVLERPLTQEDLDNGIDVKVTPAAEGEDTVVTAVVTDAEGNSSTEGKDTSVTDLVVEPATQILPNSVKMGDNLTDETPDAVSFYPNQDTTPYLGEIASVAGDDYNTALSLDTGLTNDTTPELSFSLDNPLADGQSVEVVRYVVVNGTRAIAEDITAKLTANGADYTLTDNLEQTYGTDYEYVIQLKEGDDILNEQSHKVRLDTMVEPMQVTNATFDDSTGSATVVFTARENSEVGGTVTAKYTAGGREQEVIATDDGTGNYTLDLQGFNRKDPAGIELTIVDAAGNITTQKVNFIRNLFSDYNLEQGPDTTANTFDDANRLLPRQQTSAADETAIKATDGNDTLIVGLEQFGGFGALNGSLTDEGGMLNPRTLLVDTGAGDDFIHLRGAFQGLERETSQVLMGEGNDKLQVDDNLVGYVADPQFRVDMGNGDNIIHLKGYVGLTMESDVTFGDGDDLFIIGTNFDGRKTVDFGEGNNTLQIGGYLANGGNLQSSSITFGAGNDVMTVSSNVDNIQTTIDLGDGNNYYEVGGDQRTATVISGAGDDVVLIKGGLAYSGNLGATTNTNSISTGAGSDDVTIVGQSYRGLIDLGEGDDTLTIGKVYLDSNPNQLQFNGGEGNDTINLIAGAEEYSMRTIKNFETVDMTGNGQQTLRVEINHLLEMDGNTELFIKGDAEDIVKLGTANNNLNDSLTGTGAVVWAPVAAENKVVDGITYEAYTITQTNEWVYIQQGVQVI